jgi:MgtE-like protein
LPRRTAATVFEYLPRECQRSLLKTMGGEDFAELLNEMAPDDRTWFQPAKRLESAAARRVEPASRLTRSCTARSCGRWLTGNDASTVHAGLVKLKAEDLATRDALMARLFAERGGRQQLDIVSQLLIEDFATAQVQLGKVTQRMNALDAVSVKGQPRNRIVEVYMQFSARAERLRAQLPPIIKTSRESTIRIVRTIVDPKREISREEVASTSLDDLSTEQLEERLADIARRLHERREASR